MSVATGFALLRERHSEIDTIPKPGGLGSGGPRCAAFCPVVVRLLSGICPAFVRCMFDGIRGHVEDKFQDILSKVTKKSGRSRLEPYGELIDELRGRGLTYRDIADILTDELQFHVPKSTVNDFVRERSRRRRNAARQISRRVAIPPPIVPKAASLHSGQGPSDEEVRQRIAALKARKPATTPSDNGFYFDPTEPLRLIDPDDRRLADQCREAD